LEFQVHRFNFQVGVSGSQVHFQVGVSGSQVQFPGWSYRFTGSIFRLEVHVHRFNFQVGVSGSQVSFAGCA
jgi:hypothetical protein